MDYNLTNKQKRIVNPILEKYGEVIIPHSIRFAGDTPWVVSFKTYNEMGHVFFYIFNFTLTYCKKTEMEITGLGKFIEIKEGIKW